MRQILALPVLALFLMLNVAFAESGSAIHTERVVYEHNGVELTGYLAYDKRADRDSWNWLIAYLNDRM